MAESTKEKVPYSPAAEESLLGSILIDGQIIESIQLSPDDFYIRKNGFILESMLDLRNKGLSVDYMTVTKQLQQKGCLGEIGGPARVMELLNAVPTSSNWESYAKIIYDLSQRRQLLLTLSNLAKAAYNETNDLQNEIENALTALTVKQKAFIRSNGQIYTFADLDKDLKGITWSWDKWLPNGFVTLVCGESGAGKSLLAMKICETFLTGKPFPDNSPLKSEPGCILWCESESAQQLNLTRVKAWGLPLEKIYFPMGVYDDFKLNNPAAVNALYTKALLPEVKLVVIDSLRGVLGHTDENSSETFNLTKTLADVARDVGKPVILTQLLNKRQKLDDGLVKVEMIRGSSAIAQNCRVVWAVDLPDINDKENKRFYVIKSNISEFPQKIGMKIGSQAVEFGAAPEEPKKVAELDKAIDLFQSLLATGPRPSKEVEEEFTREGISRATFDRARNKLGIESRKERKGWVMDLKHRSS